ncbi:phage tail assembly protein [Asticcacaulis endophyticus]|uniref:Phage tail assembly chaperone protein, E, or 41 or 14 n=1 Tax=Asticcacaulis endophyticus TaxID=1395890 RepID=A0A918Q3H9_9CAUL|nr:phage tail assembly protein [Asticcacaulis endophyticus]GGZ31979.1 hypothetical protein GCM10011273_17500 [Asticcacaulis endophyticus]
MTKLIKVSLDTPIGTGDNAIKELTLRAPSSGEMRGISLVELGQLKTDALITVIPRIAIPHVTEAEVSALSLADLMTIGVEVGNFLLPKAMQTASPDISKTATPT